ncbi:pantothenate transporter [Xylariales sp. PMI_506]|nr:pantothenate transporter [Xylariales sp. PMI_506]
MSNILTRIEEVVAWYPKGMPAEEKRLVRKVDLLVLTYACLSFFTKYLDVTALTNAYVSGMKDDLDLYGNRLNYINAAYEVGYVVFQIPSNLIITRVPAQYYLPAAEFFWGFFTLGTAFVNTYDQLVVMRFFVGLSATSCYVGLVHIVNSWYRKRELGRRNAIFWVSNPIGQMFAGFLQAAAYTNLADVGGLAGWRWLFIICTVITMPVAVIGLVFFPDVPEKTTSRWLTEEEKQLARKRLEEEGFKPSTGIDRTIFRRILKSWRFHAFVSLLVLFCNQTYASGTPFILWLDSQPGKYSVPLVNNISTVTNAAAVVCALTTSYYTDLRGKRWEPVVLAGVLCVFANLVLAIGNIPDGLRFFAYIAVGWSYGTIPVIAAWTAESLSADLEVRAIAFALYNCLGEITALVVPLVAWPVSRAPGFRGGFIWATLISVAYLVNTAVIWWMERREKRRSQIQSGTATVDSVSGSDQPKVGHDMEAAKDTKDSVAIDVAKAS